MMDIDATYNLIFKGEPKKLSLKLEKDLGWMKAINSKAFTIMGVVKQVLMKLGLWQGKVDYMVAWMDDFDMVLRMKFLLAHQIIPVTIANYLMIMSEDLCFVLV